MRGLIPRRVSESAAVRPAGPAPMISGLFSDAIALPAPELRKAPVGSDEFGYVLLGEVVERGLQEVQLGVLALHGQEAAEQWFGGGANDHVDSRNVECRGDVTAFPLGPLVRVLQLVMGVIRGENVDAEVAAVHRRFQVARSRDILVRQRISIAV